MGASHCRFVWLAVVATLGFAGPARAQTRPDEPDNTDSVGDFDAGTEASLPTVTVQPLINDPQAAVASGRGVGVTATEFVQRVQDAPEPVQRSWAGNPALMNELLDRLVSDQLLANEARRRGLERDPAVRAAVERALVARLRATVINPQAGDGARVTADDIRAFYEGHPQRFHIPERRRAVVVFVTDRHDAERILHDAHARRHGHPANDFRELARAHNTEPDLVRDNGEIRDVTAAQPVGIDPAVRDALFAMHTPGDVAEQLIHGDWHGTRGWFVLRYASRRPAIDRTLAESSDWIRQRLVLERRVQAERALVQQLAADARVTRMPVERIVRVTLDDAGAP